jgi:hypothetical protein
LLLTINVKATPPPSVAASEELITGILIKADPKAFDNGGVSIKVGLKRIMCDDAHLAKIQEMVAWQSKLTTRAFPILRTHLFDIYNNHRDVFSKFIT